jgi:hypothetical protein
MQVNSVRNPEGYWINSNVFREEAMHHEKYGYYCPDPWGSPAWEHYWQTQLDRCRNGYKVGGVEITGDHYFYLNFCKIEVAVQISETVAEKQEKFPAFWDGDYNYYWSLKIARYGFQKKDPTSGLIIPDIEKLNSLQLSLQPHHDFLDGGYNMIVGKARRKGYSYKNGAICANTYNHTRGSLTIIGAFEKKSLYPEGTMGMASNYLEFLNKETGWAKARESVNKVDHRRASFKETVNGIELEMGYKSDIMAVTFMDNPDAARGKDARYVLLEEAGAFPNLEASYKATQPGLRAGKFATGQIIIFGTGGDMEKGTADFARMFYNPKGYKLMPFVNIWDDNASNTSCGFFHPFYWNQEGYIDLQGNSNKEAAIADEDKEREIIIQESAGSSILQGRVQEYPKNPSEAFLTISFNDFPVVELRNRLNKVIRENIHIKKGQPVHLFKDDEGKPKFSPDLQHKLQPIWDYEPKIKDPSGAVVMFEAPIESPNRGLYKIGFDPYRQVKGESLASIIVYKGNQKFSYTRDTIVAQFIGRPKEPDDVNRIAEILAELYNAEIMHENEVTHVKNYFERRKKLHLLASQPDAVISAAIKASRVARIYGIHMVEKLKDAGEKYIKAWLLSERDVDGNGTMLSNIDTINDPGFLEELILYNRKGNFDRVMSFMMVMFQCEEEDLGKTYDPENVSDLKTMMEEYLNSMYNRNAA